MRLFKAVFDIFSEVAVFVFMDAQTFALRSNADAVQPKHLMLALLEYDTLSQRALKAHGIAVDNLIEALQDIQLESPRSHREEPLGISPELRKCLQLAQEIRSENPLGQLRSTYLFVALLRSRDPEIVDVCLKLQLDPDELINLALPHVLTPERITEIMSKKRLIEMLEVLAASKIPLDKDLFQKLEERGVSASEIEKVIKSSEL